jgi:HSP20 family protein
MTVVRWTPFPELATIPSAFDRIFGEMTEPGLFPYFPKEGYLRLDIERKNGSLVITGSLPGYKPEEVKVSIDNGLLSIEASHEEEKETKDKEYVRKERFEGYLHRELVVGEVDAGKAKAEFKDGVLTLTVPTTHKAESVKIPIAK